ncbi:uncharacterized protein LOC107047754 isoform X2 [Diachasma alloeum]|uniref:uncharacterized protein LOC107047754 isoform X2 n=1 Tax=Diachasma alloeum TaxID=454923 RepID=UPI0007383016|nr:uncharacterized protein LOC107047754 isoform X2 [Diachasma alloeum]
MSCSVCGVERSPFTQDLCFHNLPKKPESRQKWLDVLEKGDVKRLIVCSNHFRPEDYRESSIKPLLKPDAVPRRELVEIFRDTRSSNNNQIESQHCETAVDDHDYYCIKPPHAGVSASEDSPYDYEIEYEEFDPGTPNDSEGSIDAVDSNRAPSEDNDKHDDIDVDNSLRAPPEPLEKDSDVNPKNSLSGNQVLRDASNLKSSKIKQTAKSKRKLEPGYECDPPTRKRLYVGDFGVFRRQDFKDETAWNRFVNLYTDLKREASLLKRKNERLNDRVTMYKKMVAHLQKTPKQCQ